MFAGGGQPDLVGRPPEKVIGVIEPGRPSQEPMASLPVRRVVRGVATGGSRIKMPVARYFLFVGGVLLALLFALDAYVPKEPAPSSTATAAVATVDNPTLRIRSDRKWPDPVVYDTSLPTIVPPQAVKTAAAAEVPAPVAEFSAKARVRETFAQLVTPDLNKPQPQVQPKRKIAKSRTSPPMRLVAQHQNFGFFGNNTW